MSRSFHISVQSQDANRPRDRFSSDPDCGSYEWRLCNPHEIDVPMEMGEYLAGMDATESVGVAFGIGIGSRAASRPGL